MRDDIAARLKSADIRVIAEGSYFCLFVRDGCVAMVPRDDMQGFAGMGSSGMSLDEGLGYLVWHGEQAILSGQGFEIPAQPEQVELIRQFSADLKAALGLDS